MTVNLGAALAEIGYRALVIDLDPQGNATTGLGIDAKIRALHVRRHYAGAVPGGLHRTHQRKNLFVAPATIDLAGIEIELVPFSPSTSPRSSAISATSDRKLHTGSKSKRGR